MAGYANTLPTPYGTANFWQVSNFHYVYGQGNVNLTVTLSGYTTEADANNNVLPIGQYSFVLGMADILAIFGSAQPLMQNAIVHSSPNWSTASYTAT